METFAYKLRWLFEKWCEKNVMAFLSQYVTFKLMDLLNYVTNEFLNHVKQI